MNKKKRQPTEGPQLLRGSTCDELHKELLLATGEIVLPLRTLGEMFMGALAPFANKAALLAASVDALRDLVIGQNERIKQLEHELAGILIATKAKRRSEAARKRR